MNDHAKIHEATGGKVQKEKVVVHGWKCKNDKIVEVPMNTITNKKNKNDQCENSAKT